jgi:hypothetical protein
VDKRRQGSRFQGNECGGGALAMVLICPLVLAVAMLVLTL